MNDVFIFRDLSHHAHYHFPFHRRRPPGVIVGTLESLGGRHGERLHGLRVRNAYWFTDPRTRQERELASLIDEILHRARQFRGSNGRDFRLDDWPALRLVQSAAELEQLLAKGYRT